MQDRRDQSVPTPPEPWVEGRSREFWQFLRERETSLMFGDGRAAEALERKHQGGTRWSCLASSGTRSNGATAGQGRSRASRVAPGQNSAAVTPACTAIRRALVCQRPTRTFAWTLPRRTTDASRMQPVGEGRHLRLVKRYDFYFANGKKLPEPFDSGKAALEPQHSCSFVRICGRDDAAVAAGDDVLEGLLLGFLEQNGDQHGANRPRS